jgi:hypothetical protein
MWYSVVNPDSPGYRNKVVASFATENEALEFAWVCNPRPLITGPFFVISTPTKPSIGEAVDPNDLTEDERW